MKIISEQTKKLLTLKALKGVGRAKLLQLFEGGQLDLDIKVIVEKCLRSKNYTEGDLSQAVQFAESQIQVALEKGHSIVSIVDNDYPKSLLGLYDAPPILYVAGDYGFLNNKTLAIVGTREPTNHGIQIAEKITRWFCENNWNIVSGLALGIDTISHQLALQSSTKTAAVLAHGLDTIYPSANKGLALQILESGGALVTEYPYGITVRPAQLVQRDRIQAALSASVILIQSGLNGGSLHASRQIIRYGRPLIVAGQSKTDIENKEPKIEANTLLLGTDKIASMQLLKMNEESHGLVVKMHSKEDYRKAEKVANLHGWWNKQELETQNSGSFNF